MKTRKLIKNSIRRFNHLVYAFQMEAIKTQMMLDTYSQVIWCKWANQPVCVHPHASQIQQAKRQLLDLPKFLPFLGVIFLPLPGITELYILVAIAIERQLKGKISLLPEQLKKLLDKEIGEKV